MFLSTPTSPEAAAFLEKERASSGFVMNLERAWAWRPDIAEGFIALRRQLMEATTLTSRELALLVCTTARTLGDSYCALAWGARLAEQADAAMAASVLSGADDKALAPRERALARWGAQVARDPNSTTADDVEALRTAGLSEREIFEATAFIGFRLAFSTVNDALGAQPDAQLVAAAPPGVRAAVTYGRKPAA